MQEKENVTYPRSQMGSIRIMERAEKEGHLLKGIVEEFAEHPFPCLRCGPVGIPFVSLR